jgi:hypothetical protein
MKNHKWSILLSTVITAGCVLTPIQTQAEAEPLYVSGFDLDYMESNQFFAWLEDIKYSLCEVSPIIKEILEAENNLVEAQNPK